MRESSNAMGGVKMKHHPRHAAPRRKGPPKHAAVDYRPKNRFFLKRSRMICLSLAAVYLLAVVGATVYSLTVYQEKLPKVELIPFHDGKIPRDSLLKDEDGHDFLYMVEQQNGPWGKRYIVNVMSVYNILEVDDETVSVYEIKNSERAVIRYNPEQVLEDGMEVRISR